MGVHTRAHFFLYVHHAMAAKKPAFDFDLSDEEERKIKKRSVKVITVANRSNDYQAVSRVDPPYGAEEADDGVPPPVKSTKRSAPPTALRYLCGIIICLACVGLIVCVIVAAANSAAAATTTTTAVATTTVATTAAPPTAPPPPPVSVSEDGAPAVELTFLCNHVLQGDDDGYCLAVFSFDNPSGEVVQVPIGANNFVEPGPHDRGQLETFAAGTRFGGAAIRWNCVEHLHARWTLRSGDGTSVATAPRTHLECPPLPL